MTKTATISKSRARQHQTADRQESLVSIVTMTSTSDSACSVFCYVFLLKFWDRFLVPNPCGGSIMASLLRQLHPPAVGRRMIACSTLQLNRAIPNSAADYLYRESLWLQLGCEVWHGAPMCWSPYRLRSAHATEMNETIWDSEATFFPSALTLHIKCQVCMGWIQGVKYRHITSKLETLISSILGSFLPQLQCFPWHWSTRRVLGRRGDEERLRSTNLPKIDMTEEQRDLFQTAKAKFPSQNLENSQGCGWVDKLNVRDSKMIPFEILDL